MLFNSLSFLAFFGLVLVVDRALRDWTHRKVALLVASYLFYAAWNPPFVILIWVSTFIDWHVARWLGETEKPTRRKALLLLSMTTNLGLLAYFKYGGFFLENLGVILSSVGVAYQPPEWNVVLPVGISFYTFQTMSYTIDIYRGNARPWPKPLDFALFVTFFPQLVAGPIVRAFSFLPQLVEPRRAGSREFGWGLSLLVVGLFEKVVLADRLLAPTADRVFSAASAVGFVDAWLATMAFSGQIFFDFAGYSTCAIGAALCLGFELPDNFRFPYAAVGFSDFWRRWHVSLSQWLRDYLYISLGGNRHGTVRTYVNLSLTMLLGGLWHGAAWTYVIWGALHGGYLVVERGLKRLFPGGARGVGPTALAWLGTYLGVLVAWVFFRAPTSDRALDVLTAMAGLTSGASEAGARTALKVGGVTAVLLAGQWWMRNKTLEQVAAQMPWYARAAVLAAMLAATILFPSSSNAFIYFQF